MHLQKLDRLLEVHIIFRLFLFAFSRYIIHRQKFRRYEAYKTLGQAAGPIGVAEDQ